MSPDDPRALLLALQTDAPPPAGTPDEAWRQARAWLAEPQDASVEAVTQLPAPLVLALLEASVQAKAPALAAHLAQGGSPHVKAAKRALYQLRSSGVAVPDVARPVATTAPTPRATPDAEPVPSLVSPVLGTGERALVLARASGGTVTTYEVVLSDEQGVLQLTMGDLSRGAYRKHLKAVRADDTPEGPRVVVEIDLDEARTILALAAGQNHRARTPFPPGLDVALRRLEVVPREEPDPLPSPEPDDTRLAQEGALLHREPELARWLPPETQMRQLALAVDALATSPLQLNPVQRQEALGQRLTQAVEAFFTPPIRALYARRLWEMGRHFERTERPEAAARSRAEARRLFHDAVPGFPSPFAVGLFEKVLRLSGASALAEQASAEPSPPPPPAPSPLILPGR